MTSRLTVITGPPGVDIGPVAAHLGRDLADGLAIRVITPDTQPHTSPDPFHRARDGRVDERTAEHPDDLWVSPGAVRLACLPSAWQDPQTNLGIVYPAEPSGGLTEDLHTMDALGLNPAHRVTVQSNIGSVCRVLPPMESGDLGVIARDSVLRAGGRVQVEAGDGQTFLSALATVGIPPWAEWIGHLDRWIVIDVQREAEFLGTHPVTAVAADLPGIISLAVNNLDGSSGAYGLIDHTPSLRVALLNAQMLIPGIAAHDYNVHTGEGDAPTDGDGTRIADLLDDVVDRAGVEIHLIGTGHATGTGVWTWIDSGERGTDDTWGL